MMKNSGINSRMHRDIDRVCDNIRKIPYHLIDLRGSYDHIDPSVVDESLRDKNAVDKIESGVSKHTQCMLDDLRPLA